MILIGTAGHVDHGKSSLVRALTGIDPVHLPEEKERGMTIELGFAHVAHPDGYTLGIVDVPGHEKLVRTMISGATGFQLALWVVDAREGLMPQSLEHLEVLELLGAARILPVVTKADLASDTEVRSAVAAVDETLAGSRLGRFPVRVVDSISGRGIEELQDALFSACRTLTADPATLEAPAFMPIDRCFVLKGVGTVVTGTLVRGRLKAGESVALASSPEDPWRIRSLHNHSTQVATIAAGHRVGVQLHGVRAGGVERGDILVAPAYPYRSDRVNVVLNLLADKSFRLKHGTQALFLAASWEMECRLWGRVDSEGRTFVQVQLPRETCFYPGQRFILRSTNPLTTVGGGTILDLAPDRLRRITAPELQFYREGNLEAYVRDCPGGILEAGELETRWMRRAGALLEEAARSGLETAAAKMGRREASLFWHGDLTRRALDHLTELVSESGRKGNEWPLSTLARALGFRTVYARAFLESCLTGEAFRRFRGVLTLGANTLRYDPEQGGLSEMERRVAEALVRRLGADRLRPERLAKYAESSGADRKTFDKVAASLLKDGTLLRIDNEFVLERGAWDHLRKGLMELPAAGATPAEFGKRFGLTRKHSMPYLECLNRMGLMRREGDRHRVVREKVARGLSPGGG